MQTETTAAALAAALTNLQTAALSLLESATRQVQFDGTGHKFTFASPCSTGLDPKDENILESASILVAARSLSKMGRSGELRLLALFAFIVLSLDLCFLCMVLI
jgi:hypothetical protein